MTKPVLPVGIAPMTFMTEKQIEILRRLCRGNTDGSFLDLDELRERLSYTPTKQSLQFSIRALIRHDMIEKKEREIRRGRRRVVLAPTAEAFRFLRARSAIKEPD